MGIRSRRPLSSGERETIATLLRQGTSLRAIGTAHGRPKSTIAYAAAVERASENASRVDKQVRSKALTGRELRSLCCELDDNGFNSFRSLTKKVNQTRTQGGGSSEKGSVSTYTVRRAVKAMGFESRVAAKKPCLSDRNKAKRLVWCCERRGWTVEWATVFFSDENSFAARDGSMHRVWRRQGERLLPLAASPDVQEWPPELDGLGGVLGFRPHPLGAL
ncbi:hypothetical protein I4F81_009954 [Pyropia yezoensis]|uniref:Uncharacterized protein n=1 Tax=Pyropia yezoensis TaxID=2788 RepID=A0ACC3CCG9_PYRYE|nr:hypothetical protein I4F81_009954 [Neopyropia yezoensis]